MSKQICWFVGSTNDDGKTIGSTTFNEVLTTIVANNADFEFRTNPNGQTDLVQKNVDPSVSNVVATFKEVSTGNTYTLTSHDCEFVDGEWRDPNRCPQCP